MSIIRNLFFSVAVLLCADAWAIDYVSRQGKGLELSWQTEDRVGVTSGNVVYGEMEQLAFGASNNASASRNDRSLYAVGYLLKPEMAYYSYSPYKWTSVFDARNIQCRYDQQKQVGNDNPSGLAACDYQMAAATASSDAISFSYKHIGGVLRISFLAPSAMTIASLNITADNPVLATVASMDIVSQKVQLGDFAATMTLETGNLSVTKGSEVVLYLFLPAQNLSSSKLGISVKDGNGNSITLATILGPDVKAGRLYDIDLKGQARAAAKTLRNIRQDDLQDDQESTAQRAAGIANPLAHIDDILLDKSFSVQYVQAVKKGDVNGDGDVDVLDAIALIGYYTKGRTAELSTSVCDMNNDGEIDVLDAIEIVGRYTKGGS